MATVKRLYRSDTNKTWLGVLGGLGEYFGIDPTILRVLFILLVVFTGFFPGVVGYLLAALIMPVKK